MRRPIAEREIIRLRVNGADYEVAAAPNRTLLDCLREDLGLTGAKKGCDSGDCGSCTVLIEGRPVNSCLVLAIDAREKDILTIEGLADKKGLHPLQEAFIEHGAVQCGFCTSGVILSAKYLLEQNPHPTEREIRLGIAGNLCRCTGYVKIVEAIQAAAGNMPQSRTKQAAD